MAIKSESISDDLAESLKTKSQGAFNQVYEMYAPTLYGIILKIVKSEENAQDILQESFIKIWKNIDAYDASKGTLFTWMLRIARNTAIDHIRSKKNQDKIRIDDDFVHIQKIPSDEKTSDHIGLRDVISSLKPEYQHVIETVYIYGYTQEQASEKLNLPIGTVKSRIRKAIKILKEILND